MTGPHPGTPADAPRTGPAAAADGKGYVGCSAVRDGLRCHKRTTLLSDGTWNHGGGHMFMSEQVAAAFDAGDHYDATAMLGGQPFSFHSPDECPGPPDCYQSLL